MPALNANSKLEACLRRLLGKHPFELVYQDPLDSTARLYQPEVALGRLTGEGEH